MVVGDIQRSLDTHFQVVLIGLPSHVARDMAFTIDYDHLMEHTPDRHRSYIQPTYLTQKNEYNSIVETEILHQPLLCRSSLPRNIPFACWFDHITISKLCGNTKNIYFRRSLQHIDCSCMIEALQSIFDTKIYHAPFAPWNGTVRIIFFREIFS